MTGVRVRGLGAGGARGRRRLHPGHRVARVRRAGLGAGARADGRAADRRRPQLRRRRRGPGGRLHLRGDRALSCADRERVVQALILAGGEGTRLRPLTSTMPKPVVPLVDRPFISYMLEWLRGHGVDDAILSCGFMADGVRSVLGDGSALGSRLRYVEEPQPLGTGGALKFAEDLLQERFFMLNGDVLTDIDLTAQLRQHERPGARATLALVPVEDPSAYGLVRRHDDTVGEGVRGEAEPGRDRHQPDQRRRLHHRARGARRAWRPPGPRSRSSATCSPSSSATGCTATRPAATGWTSARPSATCRRPSTSSRATSSTEVGGRLARGGRGARRGRAGSTAASTRPRWWAPGCVVAAARSWAGGPCSGAASPSAPGPTSRASVLLDGCTRRRAVRASAADRRPRGVDRRRAAGSMAASSSARASRIGADNVLTAGMRIFPGVELPEERSRFEHDTGADPRSDRGGRPDRPARRRPGLPEHLRDALWRVESAGLAAHDSPGGLIVAGMGGSAIGGDLAGPRSATAPRVRSCIVARLRACRRGRRPTRRSCAPATRATPRRRSPPTMPPGRSAPGASCATTGGRLAERRAGRRRAGDPAARRLPAARGGRLLARGGARGRGLAGVGRASAHRDRRGRRARRAAGRAWGPDAPEDSLAKRLARVAARHRPPRSPAPA